MGMADEGANPPTLDERRLRRLIDVGRTLTSELDLESVLETVLEAARELTGARYAALGIVASDGSLERFLFTGIDDETREQIAELPKGRGVLGVLIDDPKPIRLAEVGAHSKSFGFPAGHPPMSTFLGVPIEIRGKAYGNLYLTEKRGTEFDAADEQAAIVLAEWAAIAIDNARLFTSALDRRDQLERAVARLEATSEIARAVGGETRLDRVLETIVKRARALVEARALVVLLEDRGSLTVAATAGELEPSAHGRMLPIDGAAWRRVMVGREAERVDDIGSRLGISLSDLGLEASSALLVPLVFRNRAIGVLGAFDRVSGDTTTFDEEDQGLLRSFAASAAMAVATAQSMAEARLRESIEASERERARWARELHDETLQGLGALRVRLAAALRSGQLEQAVPGAVAQIEDEIANLRALITELRPAALDELGLEAAIESLAESHAATTGLDVKLELALTPDAAEPTGRDGELESAIYRLVQEALTNVAKHARAEHVWIEVAEHSGTIEVVVRDDGVGFDMDKRGHGFGLVGMRERVALAGGSLSIVSTPGAGTELRGRVPTVRPAEEPGAGWAERRLA
jgi:signal transduction histidine kinase